MPTFAISSLATAALLLAAPAASAPATLAYRIDSAASRVDAKVGFLGIGSRTAHFPSVSGSVALSPGAMDRIDLNVAIDARQLSASDALTTGRLKGRNFFDVDHHPIVRFAGHALAMTGATTGNVSGDLTARGVTKPVVLAVTFSNPPARATGRETIDLTGTTTINRRDFGMTAYSFIVGRKVRIIINTRLVPA
ncbi:YceI family protein [Sphingopyxis sp. GW247-27LB]|uniref:YceI family protein n=1 Tax=Sphingopyxis sp. GW247-27LB TaxID=2012632 RepID=UPI000BA7A9C9|nr:YceI family protein [Sphingopyxis sp. GW247-27LB]PAL21411.1 polyisoprenoid-binding protein [Sphingopyxis sp. GW247-27LB]